MRYSNCQIVRNGHWPLEFARKVYGPGVVSVETRSVGDGLHTVITFKGFAERNAAEPVLVNPISIHVDPNDGRDAIAWRLYNGPTSRAAKDAILRSIGSGALGSAPVMKRERFVFGEKVFWWDGSDLHRGVIIDFETRIVDCEPVEFAVFGIGLRAPVDRLRRTYEACDDKDKARAAERDSAKQAVTLPEPARMRPPGWATYPTIGDPQDGYRMKGALHGGYVVVAERGLREGGRADIVFASASADECAAWIVEAMTRRQRNGTQEAGK